MVTVVVVAEWGVMVIPKLHQNVSRNCKTNENENNLFRFGAKLKSALEKRSRRQIFAMILARRPRFLCFLTMP
jgi:hypothetical protein